MKKILLLLLIILPMVLVAQKNKSKNVNYGFERLPAAPLEGNFKTYSVVVSTSYFDLENYGLTRSSIINDYVNFKKFERLDTKGDFEVVVRIGYPRVSKKFKSKQKSSGKGDKKKTWTEYYYEVHISTPMSYKILDGSRSVIVEKIISSGTTKKNTGSYTSSKKLNASFSSKKMLRSQLFNALGNLRNHLYVNYDKRYVKKRTYFYTIKKAKKKGLQEYEDAFQDTKALMELSVKGPIAVEEMNTKMEKALKTWKKGLQDFSPTEKKQRRVFETAGYNLGRYFLIIQDFAAAKAAIKTLSKNPKAKGEVKLLNKDLKYFEDLVKKNENIPNTFVSRYVNGAKGEMESMQGFVVNNKNDTIQGEIFYEKIPGTGVAFVKVLQGSEEQKISVMEIDFIMNDGKMYRPLLATSVEGKEEIFICELYEWYDSIIYYGAMLDKKNDILKKYILKIDSEEVIDLASPKLLLGFNKNMAKNFADCPDLQKGISEGNYTKDDEGVRNIVADYDACKAK